MKDYCVKFVWFIVATLIVISGIVYHDIQLDRSGPEHCLGVVRHIKPYSTELSNTHMPIHIQTYTTITHRNSLGCGNVYRDLPDAVRKYLYVPNLPFETIRIDGVLEYTGPSREFAEAAWRATTKPFFGMIVPWRAIPITKAINTFDKAKEVRLKGHIDWATVARETVSPWSPTESFCAWRVDMEQELSTRPRVDGTHWLETNSAFRPQAIGFQVAYDFPSSPSINGFFSKLTAFHAVLRGKTRALHKKVVHTKQELVRAKNDESRTEALLNLGANLFTNRTGWEFDAATMAIQAASNLVAHKAHARVRSELEELITETLEAIEYIETTVWPVDLARLWDEMHEPHSLQWRAEWKHDVCANIPDHIRPRILRVV